MLESIYGMLIGCCCVVPSPERLKELFKKEIKSALSSIKYKWVLVLIANYHSQSRSVKYILNNFSTLDILSKDIDFYFPGYANDVDMPLIPERETAQKDVLTKEKAKLRDLYKDLANDMNWPKMTIEATIEAVVSELCSKEDSRHNCDEENFHGNSTLTKINCKRLGTIRFSEEAFASFVMDLMNSSGGKYRYLGGCDLVMIPFFNDELQYRDCSVFHLEDMARKETRLSADAFMSHVIDTLNQYVGKLMVPQIRDDTLTNAIEKFAECTKELNGLLGVSKDVPDYISGLAHRANILMAKSNRFWVRAFGKKSLMERAVSILDEIRKNRDFIVNQVVVRGLLERLYDEAIKEIHCPNEGEKIAKIISEIEGHVHWRLTEEFYFISYSSKDKTKAELIRMKLQEQGLKVWIAPDGIPQGRDYSTVIPTTIKYTKNFVLILTENSARSKWVSREIDVAINNDSAQLKIVLADGFQLNQLKDFPDFEFYLNKVQVSFRYEDIIQDTSAFKQFIA